MPLVILGVFEKSIGFQSAFFGNAAGVAVSPGAFFGCPKPKSRTNTPCFFTGSSAGVGGFAGTCEPGAAWGAYSLWTLDFPEPACHSSGIRSLSCIVFLLAPQLSEQDTCRVLEVYFLFLKTNLAQFVYTNYSIFLKLFQCFTNST